MLGVSLYIQGRRGLKDESKESVIGGGQEVRPENSAQLSPGICDPNVQTSHFDAF